MDPDATLAFLLDAFAAGDREAAIETLENLDRWLLIGGFMPQDPRLLAANIASSRDPDLTQDERRLIWLGLLYLGLNQAGDAKAILALGRKIVAGMM
jgi:hypothetical protein